MKWVHFTSLINCLWRLRTTKLITTTLYVPERRIEMRARIERFFFCKTITTITNKHQRKMNQFENYASKTQTVSIELSHASIHSTLLP